MGGSIKQKHMSESTSQKVKTRTRLKRREEILLSIQDVVKEYTQFLASEYPTHCKMFEDRLNADPEAAQSEAVIYSVLRQAGYEVAVQENFVDGGADFLCTGIQEGMIVEVRCIHSSTITTQSGWSEKVDEKAFFFDLITDVIRRAVSAKVPQLAGHPIPRILCLTTEHIGGSFFFGPLGARDIMTSETKISVPIGTPNSSVSTVTDLKESVFFKFDGSGRVEPCRRSISALILALIHGEGANLTGLLHPDPVVKFPIQMLAGVPFLRVSNWPFSDGKIETEWTIYKPTPKKFFYLSTGVMDKRMKK